MTDLKMTTTGDYLVDALIESNKRKQAEIAALKAHIERLRSIAFPYVDLLPELVDWFNDTPQQSLAEHDAEVARKAILAALAELGNENLTATTAYIFANQYANKIKAGE